MRDLNKDINIFVACHKDFYVPQNKYLVPIQVGAKNSSVKLDMLGDDTGDNISELNPYFCELTAQYWAWKNVDCEYYGFFHYRRYFSFEVNDNKNKSVYNELYFENLTDDVIKQLKLEETHMRDLIGKYDIILPKKANLKYERNTLYRHYKESDYHEIKDLDDTIKIIHELHPEFDKYVKKAMKGGEAYFLNMYIMKKKYFFEYCEWLFPILLKFYEQRDFSNSSITTCRTPGFIAERLVMVYMLYLQDKYKDLKVLNLQNTIFENCENPYLLPKNDNKIGICMATDDKYAKHLGVALQSIADNSTESNFYDIVIFDNKLSNHNKAMISSIISQKNNFSIRFVKTSEYLKNKKLSGREHITNSSYLRFAILDLLKNYSKVIYLDCDLVLNKDLAELYEVDLKDNYVAAVRDIDMAQWNNVNNDSGQLQRKYNQTVLGVTDLFDYFNAGVMIYNIEEMRKNVSTEYLFDLAIKREYDWLDQDILNKVCYKKVLFLDQKWNYMARKNINITQLDEYRAPKWMVEDYIKAKSNPYLIHFSGHWQPIYHRDVDCAEIYWNYARRSPFYEEILQDSLIDVFKKKRPVIKVALKTKLKKLFPNGTSRGLFARRCYRLLKKLFRR